VPHNAEPVSQALAACGSCFKKCAQEPRPVKDRATKTLTRQERGFEFFIVVKACGGVSGAGR